MKKIILAGLGLGLLIGFTGSANATITGFQFSGTWNVVDSGMGFAEGDDFQGTISYDPEQPADDVFSSSGSTINIYRHNHFNLSAVGINTSPRGDISIIDNYGQVDQFGIEFYPLGLDSFEYGYMYLVDTDSEVFEDGSLPENIAGLGKLPFEYCTLNLFAKDYTSLTSKGTILSITPLPTPEPSTYTLLATGLAALAGLRKITKSPLAEHKQG